MEEDTQPSQRQGQRRVHEYGNEREERIMAKLKDSIFSHFPTLNNDNASFIDRRLQQLFTSFHTPTHPPYALMIQMAIMELNEGNGSTEQAISEFIQREYKDLPWAHVRILGLHLTKLCEGGELVCTKGGRYMLLVDGEDTECKGGNKKRKKGKKRGDHGDGQRRGTMESGEEGIEKDNELQEQEIKEQVESEKELLGVVEKQSQSQWKETGVIEHMEAEKHQGPIAQAQIVVQEPQVQMLQEDSVVQMPREDSISHLETICSSQPTKLNLPVDSQQPLLGPISEGSPKCIMSASIGLSLTHRPSKTGLGAADKMSASLSTVDIHKRKQDGNPMSGDPEQQPPKHRRSERLLKCKPIAEYSGESLLPSDDPIIIDQKPNINKIDKQWLSQPQGRGRGGGRPLKVHKNEHQFKEQLKPPDQAQCPTCSPYSEPKETFHSSERSTSSLPVNLTLDSQRQLVVPILEVSPDCRVSTRVELSPAQLQLQMSSDIDPISGIPGQQPPKHRCSGRLLKCKPVAEYSGKSLLPSEQGPKINKIEKQWLSQPQGRGRPLKVHRNENQFKEQSKPLDQAQGPMSSPYSEPKETIHSSLATTSSLPVNLTLNSQQQLVVLMSEVSKDCIVSTRVALSPAQLQLQKSSDIDLGKASKMVTSLSSVNVDELKRPKPWNLGIPKLKLFENTNFGDFDQLPLKLRCIGGPSNPKTVTDNPADSLLPSDDGILNGKMEDMIKFEQPWLHLHGQGRGQRSPPKQHRNAHRCKEQFQPQDQAQGLVSSPYSEPKKPIYSSEPTAPNFPVNLPHKFGQQLVVPISEGSPECTISTGIDLSPTQLQLQISSGIDLGATSKMEASLSSVNVHGHKQPQHQNQGSPKGKLDENPMSWDPEQKLSKLPCRGRPPKLKTFADYPEESLLPSDDGILNEKKPNINNIEKQQQHVRGRGRGRPPKLNHSVNQCARRGRPPKLKTFADYPEESLLPSDDGILNVQKPNINNMEKWQQHGRRRGWGRPPKLSRNPSQCEERLQPIDQAQHRGQGRGRGRPLKVNRNTNQCEEQSQPQDQAQGMVSSPNPGGNDNQSLEQMQLQLQSQAQSQGRCPKLESDVDKSCQKQQLMPQVRKRGRPPKTNTHVKQSQWPQLQTCQGQGHSPNQGLGQERLPDPLSDACQSHQQLQPKPWDVQGRGRGRHTKRKLRQKQSHQQLRLRVYQCRGKAS